MTAASLFVTLSLITGAFILMNLNPIALLRSLPLDRLHRPKATMKALVEDARGTRRYNPIVRQFVELRGLLASCGREENIQHINPPIREVFEHYLIQTRYIDGSVTHAIREIRRMIQNPIYAEWCNSLILCQNNNELKDILSPIVHKLSDTRSIQNELDAICYSAVKETVMLMVLTATNIPLMFFLNRTWYDNLMFTFPGQMILALTGCCMIYAIFRAIKVTRPIEYRR